MPKAPRWPARPYLGPLGSYYILVISSIIVNNTKTTILSYRELIVILIKSLNRTTLLLKYIIYYLGLYINLISIEYTISARIYYNSKNGILEEKNRKPIY
jgi:hypothetical protein